MKTILVNVVGLFVAIPLRILVITFAMESLQVVSRDRHLDVAEG